jgi:hypothetical protein
MVWEGLSVDWTMFIAGLLWFYAASEQGFPVGTE